MVCSHCLKYTSDLRTTIHFWILRLAMGKNGGDTPILRGETPKSKVHRKPHRNTLCKAFIGMGSHTKVEVPGWCWATFSGIHPPDGTLGATQDEGSQPSVTSRATSSTCTPLPTQANRPVHGGFITHVKVLFILHRQRAYPLEVSVSWWELWLAFIPDGLATSLNAAICL